MKTIKQLFSNFIGRPEGLERISTNASNTVLFDVWYASPHGKVDVGRLELRNGLWRFWYVDSFKSNTELPLIINFPDIDKEYESDELWSFFVERIPGLEQQWVQDTLRKNHVEDVEMSVLLDLFSRETLTNRYVLEKHA